jgi:secreted trypsin-like serine protease
VVSVVSQSADKQHLNICTGEVVSPHIVLTAAHCVDPNLIAAEIGPGSTMGVVAGPNLFDAATRQVLKVQASFFDDQFDPNDVAAGHDTGVVVLTEATTLTPLPFNRDPLTDDLLGQPVRQVGYGATNGVTNTGVGRKRSVVTLLAAFDDVKEVFGDPHHTQCHGDSGGPSFMTLNGVETIVGTSSFGGPKADCTTLNFDQRVDAEVDFINSFIQMFDGAGAIQ